MSAYKNARINKCAHNKETSRLKIEIDIPITLMLVTCWKECGHALHHQLALAGGNEGALYFRTQLFSHLARTAPSFSPPQEFHLKSKILSIKQPTFGKKFKDASLGRPSASLAPLKNMLLKEIFASVSHQSSHGIIKIIRIGASHRAGRSGR